MGESARRLGVGATTVLICAPVAVALAAMGLIVAELVILPVATAALAVCTAVTASWASSHGAGDAMKARIGKVAALNLAWAAIPVALIFVFRAGLSYFPMVVPVGSILIYSAATATALAFRHRAVSLSTRSRLIWSAIWVAGTLAAVVAVIFVASRFGLTGA